MLFHKHRWELKDKAVFPPVARDGMNGSRMPVYLVERILFGKVVLTFICPCGQYRIEER